MKNKKDIQNKQEQFDKNIVYYSFEHNMRLDILNYDENTKKHLGVTYGLLCNAINSKIFIKIGYLLGESKKINLKSIKKSLNKLDPNNPKIKDISISINDIYDFYEKSNIKKIRDKIYAHNELDVVQMEPINLIKIYNMFIDISNKINDYFELPPQCFDYVNSGTNKISTYINNITIIENLKKQIRDKNNIVDNKYTANITLDITTGELDII